MKVPFLGAPGAHKPQALFPYKGMRRDIIDSIGSPSSRCHRNARNSGVLASWNQQAALLDERVQHMFGHAIFRSD